MASPAQATEVGNRRTLGLGFALGAPSSLVGKYFLDGSNAIDFGFSFWRLGRRCRGGPPYNCNSFGYVGVFADYLWYDTLARGTARLDWHFGPGGRIWAGNDSRGDDVVLAARMPIGLDLTFDSPNFLEIFFDVAPGIVVVPYTDLEIEGYLGVRLYF